LRRILATPGQGQDGSITPLLADTPDARSEHGKRRLLRDIGAIMCKSIPDKHLRCDNQPVGAEGDCMSHRSKRIQCMKMMSHRYHEIIDGTCASTFQLPKNSALDAGVFKHFNPRSLNDATNCQPLHGGPHCSGGRGFREHVGTRAADHRHARLARRDDHH
jgi:hypothetical protein